MLWKISHSEAKPLNGGSAEIAMLAARNAADESGMRWIRPPSRSMSCSPVATMTVPAPKNRSALEQHVVEGVEQRGGQRQRGGAGEAAGFEGQGQTERDEDDADILDGAVGEHALQIGFHQRVQHADRRGRAAEQEGRQTPPPGRVAHADRRRCG